jgi:phosphatidylinositol alpha-1,6-mannosyltransferase
MSVLFIYINAWSGTGGLQKFNQNFLTALNSAAKTTDKVFALSLHDHVTDFPKDTRVIMHTASGSRLVFIWKAIKLGFFSEKIIVGHINILFPIAFLLPRKLVLITHGIEIWRPLSFFRKASLRKVNKVLTVSNYTKNRIEQIYPFLKRKISILPNTIAPDFEVQSLSADNRFIKRQYSLPEHAKIILTVCRLNSGEGEKGYDKVIESLSEILHNIPDVYYVLAGKYDQKEKTRLDNIIATFKLENHIIFTGYVKDEQLPSLYASCDVFIMPSKKEGFGIVFLEALMLGKPVIGGNSDGTVDALLGGETGLLINPDSKEDIVKALQSVLLDELEPRFKTPSFLRNRSLDEYGFMKYTERVRILINN